MRKTLLQFLQLFIFLILILMPITASAKTYYVSLESESHYLVDENDEEVSEENLTAGDIIYYPPNKYEVISVTSRDDVNYGYNVFCKLLENKKKDNGVIYVNGTPRFHHEWSFIRVKEMNKNALDSYKKIKKLNISNLETIPSHINKKVKKLTELTIDAYYIDNTLIKKNAFANCKKLSTIELDYHCSLEKNSFKNVRATVWYDNGTYDYDKVKGRIYKTVKSISQIKKEIKRAGFKKGTIVKVIKYKKDSSYSQKVYKTIKI